jgi:DNA-binding SARP family transcriptional activator/tetratricopeptide (TPR) repeat protein
VVVREVLLHGIEQLLIGSARELRPALAVSDPLVAFDHRRLAVAGRHLWMCPAEVVQVGPIHARDDRRSPLAIRFQDVAVSAGASETTRVQLCGRLSIEIGGVHCAERLRGRQTRLLLAYLLLNRSRHVGREELIGALWTGQPPASEDAALRTLLSRLRSGLGAAALSGRDELILSLPEPVWIDLEAASSELGRALQALERADARVAWALAQVPLNIASRGLLPGTQARWLEPPRRDLEDTRLQALEVIGRAGLGLGGSQLASVERAARGLIDAEPYRESGYVLLMEALAARGNVAEAVRVFERLRTLLRDELGTAPSPNAIEAHERLLRPATRAAAPGGAERGGPAAASIELPGELHARAAAALVGRRRELGELARLWADARVGAPSDGRIVVIAGDAGIGKTSLAAELARRAHADGGVVLAGRSPEEALVPYQPFLEALRHYVATAPGDELRRTTRDYGPELARLVPELARRLGERPPPIEEPESERYRLFEAVVGLFTAISASAPILLVLDDLHWADRPTLLLLRHLARSPEPRHLLILVAYRTEATGQLLGDALADLKRERLLALIDVAGLSQRETAELVRMRTGEAPSQALARALHSETEGNPFFIEEIVRNLAEVGVDAGAAGASELRRVGLPEGVKQMIARRTGRLKPKTIEWLRVAAVIGRDFDAALLEQLLELDEEQFLLALEEALAAGLLLESSSEPGRYSFSHTLIRDALYEGMSAARRARIHRRVGEALEAAGETSPGALAHHFTHAASREDAEKAISYARAAADRASELQVYEEAAEHYTRAVEVATRFAPEDERRRCELLLALGESWVKAGERQQAWAAFRLASELAQRLGDPASLARAAIGASRRYVQEPGVVDDEVIGLLNRALELTDGERTLDRVKLLNRLCGAIYYSAERDRMAELSREAMRIAADVDDPEARVHALAARRRALWNASRIDERLATSTEMLTRAQGIGDLELQLQAHAWLVVDLLEHGERDAVDAQISAFSAGAAQLRQPLYIWQKTVWSAMRALLDGQLEQADELAAEAVAAGAPGESVTAPQYYGMQLLAIRREQGRIGELGEAARRMLDSNPDRPAWRAAFADVLLETGRLDEAAEQLAMVAAHDFEDIPRDGDWMTTVTLLSEVSSGLGDAPTAARLYELLTPFAQRCVVIGLAALCLGSAARFLGKLAVALGDQRAAAEHFEQALEVNSRLKAPLWLAHTRLDYGQALGRGARGQRMIDEAKEAADLFGLTALGRRVEQVRS